MVPRLIGTECLDVLVNGHSRELAIYGRNGQHLMSRSLNRSRLVQCHVARSGGDNTLVGAQQSRNNRSIGLRASHKEVNLPLITRKAARRENLRTRRSAILIRTVAYALLQIGTHQSLQNLGVRTLHIIAVEVLHRTISIKICANLSFRYSLAIIANDA